MMTFLPESLCSSLIDALYRPNNTKAKFCTNFVIRLCKPYNNFHANDMKLQGILVYNDKKRGD